MSEPKTVRPDYTLVLLRHGQSTWNLENRFTGWVDVDLSDLGRVEAKHAGIALREHGLTFDLAYTSVLRRAIKTLWITLETLELEWIPVRNAWQLNERHYGALQGLNKAETAAEYGEEQVKIWRRSYDTPPPALQSIERPNSGFDRRYASLGQDRLPRTESLKDTVARMLPFWEQTLAPIVRSGQRLLIAAHGNSLRALVKHLDGISDADIAEHNIPTGIPLVYELDTELRPLRSYYLGDEEAVRAATAAVANQAKAK